MTKITTYASFRAHRRAGPSRHQAVDQADVQFQIVPVSRLRARRHRTDTYDQKGQFPIDRADAMSFADQFSAQAEWSVQFERRSAGPGNPVF